MTSGRFWRVGLTACSVAGIMTLVAIAADMTTPRTPEWVQFRAFCDTKLVDWSYAALVFGLLVCGTARAARGFAAQDPR